MADIPGVQTVPNQATSDAATKDLVAALGAVKDSASIPKVAPATPPPQSTSPWLRSPSIHPNMPVQREPVFTGADINPRPNSTSLHDQRMANAQGWGAMLGNAVGMVANQKMQEVWQEKTSTIGDYIDARNHFDESKRIIDDPKSSPEAKAEAQKVMDDAIKIRDRIQNDKKKWGWVQKGIPNYVDPKKNKPEDVGPMKQAIQERSAAQAGGYDNSTPEQQRTSDRSDAIIRSQGGTPNTVAGVANGKQTAESLRAQESAANNPVTTMGGVPVRPAQQFEATPQSVPGGAPSGPQEMQARHPGESPVLLRRPEGGGTLNIPADRITPAARAEASREQGDGWRAHFPSELAPNPAYQAQLAHEQKIEELTWSHAVPAWINQNAANARAVLTEAGKAFKTERDNITKLAIADKNVEAQMIRFAAQQAQRDAQFQIKYGVISSGGMGAQSVAAADKMIKDLNTGIKDANTDMSNRDRNISQIYLDLKGVKEKDNPQKYKELTDQLHTEQKYRDLDMQERDKLTKQRDDALDGFKKAGIGGASSAGVSGVGSSQVTSGGGAQPVGGNAPGQLPTAVVTPMLQSTGMKYGVNPNLLASMMMAESGGYYNKTSESGAVGPMQVLPSTAAKLAPGQNPNDPAVNIDIAGQLMQQLLTKYNGNVQDALTAYNVGPENYDKAGRDISRLPTDWVVKGKHYNLRQQAQNYVPKVLNDYALRMGGGTSGGTSAGAAVSAGQPTTAGGAAQTTGSQQSAAPISQSELDIINSLFPPT